MKYLFIIILLLLVGCGKKQLENPDHGIDPEFEQYVQKFETLKGGPIAPSITINFTKELPGDKFGLCTFGNDRIQINTYSWNTLDNQQRLVLLMHEMGHCDLRLSHDDRVDAIGMPVSLMNTRLFNFNTDRETYYFNQLFGR